MREPKVTVLMSVYNGEKYLREAIDSILGQTFTDFEFIIINDGSTDGTLEILESYHDPRIVVVSQENRGLTKSLNKGLAMARGEYVARMDSDDISLANRLERQIYFMDRNPEVGVCGCWVKTDEGDNTCSIWKHPTESDVIESQLFFETVLVHSSVIIRKKYLTEFNLQYNESFNEAQDYELWTRCVRFFLLQNIPEILLIYRIHKGQIGKKHADSQKVYANLVRVQELTRLGIKRTDNIEKIHLSLCSRNFGNDKKFAKEAAIWLARLLNANQEKKVYPVKAFSKLIWERWRMVLHHVSDVDLELRLKTVKLFLMCFTPLYIPWRTIQ